ncbi:hypothetical protein ACFU6I_34535 [Streptomyces sp. NPDC057486]|uniref:hypothetical protein n=1 Tax=Streptomyces sp. NPDC057486 TaxID=3346145 RepID=UPI003676B4FA
MGVDRGGIGDPVEYQGGESDRGLLAGVFLRRCAKGALWVGVGQPEYLHTCGAAALAQQEQQLPCEGCAQRMLFGHAQQRHAQFVAVDAVAVGGQQPAVPVDDLLPVPLVWPGREVPQSRFERVLLLAAGLVEEHQLLVLLPGGDSGGVQGGAENAAWLILSPLDRGHLETGT